MAKKQKEAVVEEIKDTTQEKKVEEKLPIDTEKIIANVKRFGKINLFFSKG